jgi:hypothetical protein
MCGSTRFGRFSAHHQKPTTALGASGFTVGAWRLKSCWSRPVRCWATHKRQVINLWNFCILLVNLFESYDNARTCERQIFQYIFLFPSIILLLPPYNFQYDIIQSGREVTVHHVRFSQSTSVALRGGALLNRSRDEAITWDMVCPVCCLSCTHTTWAEEMAWP